MSRLSLGRATARAAVVGTVLAGLLAAGVGIAAAHVTVSSPNATAGGYGKVVFSVPNESDSASTTRVRIQLPEKTPFASVLVEPVPGWTATTTSTNLTTPIKTDDGQTITSATSVIDLTATAGGIAPGQFQEFSLSVGPFPKNVKTLSFSAVQTYSDGTEVAWIDPTVPGQPEPQHPAPVLILSSSSSGTASSGSSSSGAGSGSSSSGSGTLPLVLSIIALVAGLGGLALGWRAQRRTVAR